jgi:TonB family protein
MINIIYVFLLMFILLGCKSTTVDLTVKPGKCYQIEYTAKPHYTLQVSQKTVAAINRFNNCDFVEAQTILNTAMPMLANDNMLIAAYHAQMGAYDMMKSSLDRGNYQQVISSSKVWTNFVKIENDPRIIKELYIAYRMLKNDEKTTQLAALAFETTDAAESYFSLWHQKSFPQHYKNKKINVTLALLDLMHEQLQSMNELPSSRYPGDTVNTRLNRTDLSKPFSIYKVAPEAISPGWVILSFSVNKKGRTEDIKVIDVSPVGGFEADAINTLSKWLYLPAESDNGKAIKTENLKVKLEVNTQN